MGNLVIHNKLLVTTELLYRRYFRGLGVNPILLQSSARRITVQQELMGGNTTFVWLFL